MVDNIAPLTDKTIKELSTVLQNLDASIKENALRLIHDIIWTGLFWENLIHTWGGMNLPHIVWIRKWNKRKHFPWSWTMLPEAGSVQHGQLENLSLFQFGEASDKICDRQQTICETSVYKSQKVIWCWEFQKADQWTTTRNCEHLDEWFQSMGQDYNMDQERINWPTL